MTLDKYIDEQRDAHFKIANVIIKCNFHWSVSVRDFLFWCIFIKC